MHSSTHFSALRLTQPSISNQNTSQGSTNHAYLSLSKRDYDYLDQLNGIRGLASELKTDIHRGIEADARGVSLRRQTFGSNAIQMPAPKMLQIVLETFKDPFLVVLFMCAALSLGFGIKRDGIKGVSDGLSILVSIFLAMAAASFSNIWVTRQFHTISKYSNSISSVVIRDGREQHISADDVVVGDLAYLKIGDRVPADGLYIAGDSFRVNESVHTEEDNSVEITEGDNQFLLAGSNVVGGYARMLITAVGMDTNWRGMMSSKFPTQDRTPLQAKLHKLTQMTT